MQRFITRSNVWIGPLNDFTTKLLCKCENPHITIYLGWLSIDLLDILYSASFYKCCDDIVKSIVCDKNFVNDFEYLLFKKERTKHFYVEIFVLVCRYQSLKVISIMWYIVVNKFTQKEIVSFLIYNGIETACNYRNVDAVKFITSTRYYTKALRLHALNNILCFANNVDDPNKDFRQILELLLTRKWNTCQLIIEEENRLYGLGPTYNATVLFVKSFRFSMICHFLFNELHMTFSGIDKEMLIKTYKYLWGDHKNFKNIDLMQRTNACRKCDQSKIHTILSIFTCRDVSTFSSRFVGGARF